MIRAAKSHARIAATMAAAAIIACALVPSTASAAERTVTVTASATLTIPNDAATVGVGVKRDRKTRGDALQATSAALGKALQTARAIPGVGEGDVSTGRISVRPIKKGETTWYRATEGGVVTLHEPSEAGELVAKVLAAGATGVRGPTYSVGNREEAFGKALTAAVTKAHERAVILAAGTGAAVGKAITIEEGEGQREIIAAPPEAASVKGAKSPAPTPPPTNPGTSTVKATVHVVFELT
jgi:uncharacterized protein YggE